MVNSFGEYTIAKSSSSDIKNIKFSQRHPADSDRPKNKKKKRNISPTNIIYTSNIEEKSNSKKLFVVENKKTKSKFKKKSGKSVQTSSASNYVIKPGFKRPGR